MPVGQWPDMAACVAANQSKEDPAAYCASIEQADKADAAKRFTVAKVDESLGVVFGWASVSVKADGEPLEDLQGDIIEPQDLEKAAYDFVLYARGLDEMHEGRVKGQMVESLFVSPEKLKAMGLTATKTAPQVGWWVGFKPDADVFQKVKAGQYAMFSIELRGRREPA
jgi:hypothetical protein